MTLVIAERRNCIVRFSSDSRLTFSKEGHIDFGVKILSIPVKIFSPTNKETQETTLVYDHSIGLAIAGSAINALIIKETVSEILQHLQYIPGVSDFSMSGISKLIFQLFKKASTDLSSVLREKGLCELILGGYCPDLNKIRVFKHSVNVNSELEFTCEEVLSTDGLIFLGSGKEEAILAHSEKTELTPLHLIREVIRSGKVSSVGGGLQYGEFDDQDFKIFGIADYTLTDEGRFNEHIYTLRGINIYKDEFEKENEGFHIAYTFKMPFQNEINKILQDLIKELDNSDRI